MTEKINLYKGNQIEEEVLFELLSLDYRIRVNETLLEYIDLSSFLLKTETLKEEYATCDWYIKKEKGILFFKGKELANVIIKDEEGHVDVDLDILNPDLVEEIWMNFYGTLLKEKLTH